jgi:hypothetical protein
MKNESIDTSNLLRDFIFDSIIIFYLVLLLKKILALFQKNNDNDEKNDILQSTTFLTDIVVGIVINLYYVLKENKLTSTQKNEISDN